MKRNRIILKAWFLTVILVSIIYISCEIGLGAAVDTQAPEIRIEKPEVDKVIRDKFNIGGSWEDDGSIGGIRVVLKRTDGKALDSEGHTIRETEAEYETSEEDKGKGSWKALIDPTEEGKEILDGTYQATVYINDLGNHQSSQSTTFTIDNTGPVIVLTRPSTAATAANSDTYGQTFNLEGQAADNNNVSLIEVRVYNDEACEEEEHPIQLKNVPNSINMDAAIYDKEKGGYISQDEAKYNFEVPLETGSQGKDFYCKIVAYDGAERFPLEGEQSEEDKKGNAVDYYYLYKDIATEVLQNYKITEVYSIYNGTYSETGAERSVSKADVLSLLESKKTYKGRFTLNPKNNPTFTVTGKSPIVKGKGAFEGTAYNITNGSQVVLEVSPGLDGILLKEETLHVYAQKCDDEGKIDETASKIDITTGPQESGTSYKFITSVGSDKGFEIGSNYIIWVDGEDYATVPNKVEAAGGVTYGFHMSASGKAPVLEITEPAGSTEYSNRSKQMFRGTVCVEEGEPEIVITGDGNEIRLKTFTEKEVLANEIRYSFEWESGEFTGEKGTHNFTFKAVLDSESQPVERTIVYDTEKPVIDDLKITEAKKYDPAKEDGTILEGRYLNGKVTVSAGITDDYDKVKSASYRIIINDDEEGAAEVQIADPTKFTFPEIDTTGYADGSKLTIKITASDRAGNTQTHSEDFTVDQETDKPVVWPRNSEEISLKNTTVSYYRSGTDTKKGIITAGSNLELKVYDDDGSDRRNLEIEIKVSGKLNSDSDIAAAEYEDVSEYSMIDDVVSFKVPDDGGYYCYRIKVKDKSSGKIKEVPQFVINAARAAATITGITKSPSYIRNEAGEQFEVKIEGVSSLGPYQLYRKIGEDGSFERVKQADDFPITDTITLGGADEIADGTKVYYYVQDATPRDSNREKYIDLHFDDEAPEVTITSPNALKKGVNALSESVPFSGRASDGKSGVEKIFYKFSTSKITNPSADGTEGGYTEVSAVNGPWELEQVTFKEGTEHEEGKLEEGTWYFYVYAQDAAGNKGEVREREFDINLNGPELGVTVTTGEHCKDANGAYYFSGDLTGIVTASDTDGDVTLDFQLDGVSKDFTVDDTGNSPANFTVLGTAFTESKQQKLTVTAADRFGKTKTESYNVYKDSAKPVLSVTNPGKQETKAVTIAGSVNDLGVGVKSVKWSSEENGSYEDVTEFTKESPGWNLRIEDLGDEGPKSYYFKAEDEIGNTETKHIEFIYDKGNPTLTINASTWRSFMPSEGLSVTGQAQDSYKLKELRVTQSDGSTKTITFDEGSELKSWIVDIPFDENGNKKNPENEEKYSYTFELEDAAGNTVKQTTGESEADFTAPVLSITAPDGNTGVNAVNEANYQLKGRYTEKNISGIYYKILESSQDEPEAVAETTRITAAAWTGAGWTIISAGTETWSFYQKFKAKTAGEAVEGLKEGSYKVYIFAVDGAGNISTSQAGDVKPYSQAFDVDMASPVVTVDDAVSGTYYTASDGFDAQENKGDLVLSGTASDTNGISSVEITGGPKTYTPSPSAGRYSVTLKYGSGNASEQDYLGDGTYTFRVKATDTAGKTSEVTKTITVDTAAPVLSGIKVNGAASDSEKWYNTTDMKMEGVVSDNEGGSGVSEVVYQTSTDGNTWGEEEPFIGTSTWKGTVSDAVSKTTRIKITARDNAGNETSETVGPWNIDINPPSLTQVKEGDKVLSEAEAYYSNGGSDIVLKITAADGSGESGVDRVYVRPYTKLTAETVSGDTYKAVKDENNGWYTYIVRGIDKSGTVYARIYDKAGNYSDENLFAITYDNTKPVLQSINLVQTADGKTTDAYKKDETTYYVNPDGRKFTLSGIATDNLAVGSVSVTMKKGDEVKHTGSDSKGEYTLSDIDMSGWGGDETEIDVTVTVTDRAGNTQNAESSVTSNFTIIFDKTEPVSTHGIDSTGKDIVFRVSDFDNNDITSSTASEYGLTWNSATVEGTAYTDIDTKAGGKYGAGTYGNSTTQKIRGVFEDSGSGIRRIYYAVFDRTDSNRSEYILDGDNERYDLSEQDLEALKNTVIGKNQYFVPGEKEYKRVFYNVNKEEYDAADAQKQKELSLGGKPLVKGGQSVTEEKNGKTYYKYWKVVPSTYSFTIPRLTEGSNYLVLVAEDNAGNLFLERKSVKFDHDGDPLTDDIEAEFSNFSLNLDTTAPVVEALNNALIYSNGTDECSISVTASDPDVAGIENSSSGVKSVVFSRDGTAATVKAQASGNTYTADIKDILPDSAAASIYATVTDNAGTSSKKVVANVIVDKDGPEVTVKSPAAGSTVNGKVKLSVTAGDGNGAGVSDEEPVLYIKNGDEYTALSKEDHPYSNGEFTVDTTKFTDNANVILRVTFTDAVGNEGNSADRTLYVSQDSDRPVIKMNQVSSDGGYITSKTVFGSVTDDDGTISKLWVWSAQKKNNAEPQAAPVLNGSVWDVPDGWIEFGKEGTDSTLENNNWQIESTENDGDTKWFWAVADANNTVFWTKGAELGRPYITYSNIAKQDDTDGIPFKYDTESPEITGVGLLRLATDVYKQGTTTRYAASEIKQYVTDLGLEWSSANNMVFGKDYALMYVMVEVNEKTGMNETAPVALDYITLGSSDIWVTDPDSNNKYTYYLGPFDLSGKDTENVTLTFTAKDEANKSGTKEKSIIVDNSADITISDVSPSADEIASGKFSYRGQVSDAQSSVTRVEYYIPKSAENAALSGAATDAAKKTLLDSKTFIHIEKATSIQWTIDFNNFNDDVLKYTTNGVDVIVDEGFAGYKTENDLYRIPVWFKVTDSVGNTGYVTDNIITYDPNEDRPKVYITDPEIKADEFEEKGGKVKISGNAQDNEGVAAVYLQFKDGDGEWTSSAAGGAEAIPGTNPVIYGFKANNTRNWNFTRDLSKSAAGLDDGTIVQVRAIAADSDTGLLSAWSDVLTITINNSIPRLVGDMYLRQYEGNTVKVEKVYEPDMYIKGEWKLEGTIATPGSDYLTQMRITVGDKEAVWTRSGDHTGSLADSGNIGVTVNFAEENNDQNLAFSIPVSGSSEWSAEILTVDYTGHEGREKPVINIDDTAPSFADYSDKEHDKIILYQDSYGAGGTQLGANHFVQNSNGAQFTLAGKIVENQSGFDKAVFYFMRTGSSDNVKRVYNPMEGHGTDNQNNRADFASSRANAAAGTGGTIYLNDNLPCRPLTVGRSDEETASAEEIKTNMNIRVGGLVYIGGLYRLITQINRTDGTVKFEPAASTSSTSADFVYGLVVDHNGERDGGSGAVEFDDGDGLLESYSGSTTANFRWEATFNSANIPDGPIEIVVVTFDKAGNIGYGSLVTKASNNAPRITKVMLGTDLNGNGVYDYDTDEFSTFYAYKDEYGYGNTKKGNAAWTLDTSEELDSGKYWTVKNGLAVIPEFVGGAGPFYYVFDKGVVSGEGKTLKDFIRTTPKTFTYKGDDTDPKLSASGLNSKIKTGGQNGANASWTYGSSSSGDNTGGSLTLANNVLGGEGEYSSAAGTNPAVVYSFTFWDSTEESTPGSDTGSTILNAYVKQDLTDDVNPNTVIAPFEWKGTGYTKNVSKVVNGGTPSVTASNPSALAAGEKFGVTTVSVTEGSITTVTTTTITPNNSLYGASRANGHIELEADLSDAIKNLKYNETQSLGEDPKVSGKITFHGTSYDNTRLSSIWFKFTDFTANNGKTEGDSGKDGTSGYTQAAWYNPDDAAWSLAGATMAANNWEVFVSDTYFNQTGHKADWYLSIDTSAISGNVGVDKKLTVITLDSSGKVSSQTVSGQSSDGDDVYNCPEYQMDVVPYVTSLTTSLSGFQSTNPSVYDRTALGHYPVYMTHAQGDGTYDYETVKVNGFNLEGTQIIFDDGYTTGTDNKGNAYVNTVLLSAVSPNVYSFALPNGARTGKVTITKNVGENNSVKVTSLNNKNNNDAHHSDYDSDVTQSGWYNRCPNGVNNDLLTDDLIIDVWDFNSQAAIPNDNSAKDIMMKINPNNGIIGFAFANGMKRWSMANDDYSYLSMASTNDFIQCTGFAYDSNGYSYGTAAGGESDPNLGDAFIVLSSRWTNTEKATNNLAGLRIELNNQRKDGIDLVNKTRFVNPSFAVRYNTDESSDVYLAFYDDTNGEIRFRAGNLPKTFQLKKDASFGLFKDRFTTVNKGGITPPADVYLSNLEDFQILANDKNEALGSAGEYLSLGVTSDNVVIIVWYDSTKNKLMCSYNTDPLTTYNAKDETETTPTKSVARKGGFENPEEILSGACKYCKIAVDGNDNFHIAAFDGVSQDLKYIYIPKTSDSNNKKIPDFSNMKVCTVDSYLSVGKELTIDVAAEVIGDDTYYIPHIGYYANTPTKPRYAYIAEPSKFFDNNEIDGTVSDKYTGIWECTIVPTKNKVTIDSKRRINVGVWKTSTGIRRDSKYIQTTTTDGSTTTTETNKGKDSFANTANGKCYGNGSDNAVLGYGVQFSTTADYVETAQKR